VKDSAEEGDDFGMSIAGANFGKSSHADLAIGAYGETLGTNTRAGAVNVLYGSATGITATGTQFWTEGSSGVAGTGPSTSSGFGCGLAPGTPCRD
jgi:hypothetical protein